MENTLRKKERNETGVRGSEKNKKILLGGKEIEISKDRREPFLGSQRQGSCQGLKMEKEQTTHRV